MGRYAKSRQDLLKKLYPEDADTMAEIDAEEVREKALAANGYLHAAEGDNGSKCTPEFTRQFCRLLELGMTPDRVCERLAMPKATYYTWLHRAGQHKEPYLTFARKTIEAEGKFEERLLEDLLKPNPQSASAQSIRWLLERRFPERYAKPKDRPDFLDRKMKTEEKKADRVPVSVYLPDNRRDPRGELEAEIIDVED